MHTRVRVAPTCEEVSTCHLQRDISTATLTLVEANQPSPSAALYDIEELAELAGVSRRTVRFYVQRGLLSAPTGTGRGKHYTQQHLDRLVQVRTAQQGGATLEVIERALTGSAPPEPVQPAASVWTRLTVTEGVELHLRGTWLSPAALSRIGAAVRAELSRMPTSKESDT
jgi:DNA-binding transcriptional MerR regulator